MSYMESSKHAVFGVEIPGAHTLYIGYCYDCIESHTKQILHQLYEINNDVLLSSNTVQDLHDEDLFEIESVRSQAMAEEAVKFWTAYFQSLGETVIVGRKAG